MHAHDVSVLITILTTQHGMLPLIELSLIYRRWIEEGMKLETAEKEKEKVYLMRSEWKLLVNHFQPSSEQPVSEGCECERSSLHV